LIYIPRCSNPTILSLHAEFIIFSGNNTPIFTTKINAINNATDISNIEEVVGSTCFDFATNFLTGSGKHATKYSFFHLPSDFLQAHAMYCVKREL
jgi:hypothetical protein